MMHHVATSRYQSGRLHEAWRAFAPQTEGSAPLRRSFFSSGFVMAKPALRASDSVTSDLRLAQVGDT